MFFCHKFVKKATVYSRIRFSNGTSMISLIVPPKDQISRLAKMLGIYCSFMIQTVR
jgi:peptide subunit release factor 1 (eRF1)